MNSDLDSLSSSENAHSEEPKKEEAKLPFQKGKKVKPTFDSSFDQFSRKFTEAGSVEDRIHLAIEYMRNSLSQEGAPRFKEFWEVRRMCLPLFKEGLNSVLRNQLWSQFLELSNEALRLKEILAEQATFAVEQIDLAIQAFEEDLKNYDRMLSEIPPLTLPQECQTLSEKIQSYTMLQRELNLLGALASRINSLRKELLKTDMRIRDKNRFFKRLSDAGGRVFPRRKELIQKVSDDFLKDVDAFISKHFLAGKIEGAPLYILREEIKSLQGIAKMLTLNTQAFTETRLKLSECWDKVKVLEKERKKEISAKKQVQQQNRVLLEEKMKIFAEKAPSLSFEEKKREWDELFSNMRNLELGREDLGELRAEFERLKSAHMTREKRPNNPPKEAIESPYVKAAASFESRLNEVSKKLESFSVDDLESEYRILLEECQKAPISREDRDMFSQKLGPIQDTLLQKKEQVALESGGNSEILQEVLELRRTIRQEVKSRLDSYRRTAGGSGFDFEQAMKYRELVDLEKERLDKIDDSISALEEKLESSEER